MFCTGFKGHKQPNFRVPDIGSNKDTGLPSNILLLPQDNSDQPLDASLHNGKLLEQHILTSCLGGYLLKFQT